MDRGASSLWGLAKRLATARARRGKTNWEKLRKRVIPPRRKKSFWSQAKSMVYGTGSREPDRKILKVL